ncbi:MAG: Eco57I restriction-modification methylase domain-containing protein [Firmicutes bacterium]|nr:Eco57I restriction-modification methylase domain-containing protein [Bacillota bacterium]
MFNEKYNREKFELFLKDFLPDDYVESVKDVTDLQRSKLIHEVKELGFCESLGIHVLEMSHSKEKDPRISIATDAFKILADHWIHKALVIFKNNDSENYRFSYLTISLDVDDKNKIIKRYSNAHRYSFFLGVNAKVKTPEQQLVTRGQVKNADDLLSRFSVEVVNKQFYLDVAKFFDELVSEDLQSLALPSQVDDNIRKNFAVRLIGRIMFCWFLKQKKSDLGQLVPDELLSSSAVIKNYYHKLLEPLFFEALNTNIDERGIRNEIFDKVPYLNGGLFSPQSEDYYDFDRETFASRYINTLKISDKWFQDFFELLETYNFTIDENTVFDQELSVDPEMLGRIFENLLAEINPETGSSDRKRTGSFYTPRQIVEYMVDQSLIEFLKTKTSVNEDKLRALLSYDEADDLEYPLTKADKSNIIDAIDSLRMLDPACGSGAFPMGALQKIVYILQVTDPNGSLWRDRKLKNIPELYRNKIEEEFNSQELDYIRKLEVIKNSIFGVDIQPIAVEVSRLRCFLTLVVESEIDDSKKNRGIQALPNLDFKFVCANTIIPAPEQNSEEANQLFGDQFTKRLASAIDGYFGASGANKISSGNEIHKLIDGKIDEKLRQVNNLFKYNGDTKFEAVKAEMNKKQIEAHTRTMTLWASYKNIFENKPVGFFDPKYFFPSIKEGFDIVIGNPPYIDSETMVKTGQSDLRKKLSKIYKSTKGNWDFFIPFIEKSLILNKNKGILSFIVPNKLISQDYAKTIRDIIISNQVIEIRDYSRVDVFSNADVYPITIVVKKQNGKNFKARMTKMKDLIIAKSSILAGKEQLMDDNWDLYFNNKNDVRIIEKINSSGQTLSDLVTLESPCTVSEAYKLKEVMVDQELIDDNKKFINSGTIDPYTSLWGFKNTKYIKGNFTRPSVSQDEIICINERRLLQANSAKIIIANMTKNIEAFFDIDGDYLAGKSTSICLGDNMSLKIATALLNSKVVSYWYKIILHSSKMSGGALSISPKKLATIPIPKFTNEKRTELTDVVDQILKISKSENYDPGEQSVRQDQLIDSVDEMVYSLYKLTPKERKIIEESTK